MRPRLRLPGLMVALLAAGLLAGGCQQVSALLFPVDTLQLVNEASTAVNVRVGRFDAPQPDVTGNDVLFTLQLPAQGSQAVTLSPGHYELYVEAATFAGGDAVSSLQLSAGQTPVATVQEKLTDRPGLNGSPGYEDRTLGWSVVGAAGS